MSSFDPILVSVDDAGAMIARSRPTVYKLIASGEIRAKKHGGRTLIVVESLRAWASGLPDVPPTPAS